MCRIIYELSTYKNVVHAMFILVHKFVFFRKSGLLRVFIISGSLNILSDP